MTRPTTKLVVAMNIAGADALKLDELTRNLGNELRNVNVESVERASEADAPPGSKGDPFTLGWLTVTLGPALITKVFDVLVEWATRDRGRTLKVTLGQDTIELPSASREERQKVIDKWLRDAGHPSTA